MPTKKTPDLYQWDLEAILENEPLDKLYKQWLDGINQLLALYPKIFDTLENFKHWLKAGLEMSVLSNRLYNYVSNNANLDVTNPTWIGYSQKMRNDSNNYNVVTSDYENRVLENMDKVQAYLKDSEVQAYQRSFDLIFREKPHILSKVEEKLLAELSHADGGVSEIYEALITSDIQYQPALDSHQQVHEIKTLTDAFLLLKSRDGVLRKNAWINFHQAYYQLKNSLTHAVYYNFLELNTGSKIHKFTDYISACCFDDEIDKDLIPHIYKQVETYQPLNATYRKHRDQLLKQILNLKTVEIWDNNVDLCHKDIKFTIEEAQALVLEALAPLGAEYTQVVKKAFTERWISWLPQPNKYTGAYSIGGTKGLKKFYILMNYDKTLNSVSTLIHELGHSLNSYYYNDQKVYASTSIFTAEVASITNEMLLNYHLLTKYAHDDEMQLMVLDELISGFFATTSRQIVFSNFEWIINEKINQNEPVTFEVMAETYKNLNAQYLYSPNTAKYAEAPYSLALVTPLRISHFFAGNFYVYKYAIGQIVACLAAYDIVNHVPGAIERYKQFLQSGTSRSPLETIKLLGIDLHSAEPWQRAKAIMQEFVDKFTSIKSVKKAKVLS